MTTDVREYLNEIRSHLRLDPETEKQVMGELLTHFSEKLSDLKEHGLSQAEAARKAIESFGRPKVIARLTYEAFGRGSWSDAVLAALPNVLVAVLFATHLWGNMPVVLAALLCIVGVTMIGWWHGKPNWAYSWIGYSLAPVLILGYMSRIVPLRAVEAVFWCSAEFPGIAQLVLVIVFYLTALYVVSRMAIRVVRRDWILASFMLVPLPIIGSWLFFLQRAGGLNDSSMPWTHLWDNSMAMAFLALAAASAGFIRLRRRAWKLAAVVLVGSTALVALGPVLWGGHSLLQLAVFFFVMVLFLLSPALVEARVGHGEPGEAAWWNRYWRELSSVAHQG